MSITFCLLIQRGGNWDVIEMLKTRGMAVSKKKKKRKTSLACKCLTVNVFIAVSRSFNHRRWLAYRFLLHFRLGNRRLKLNTAAVFAVAKTNKQKLYFSFIVTFHKFDLDCDSVLHH